MRTAFIEELLLQAELHQDIFLVVGDLGYSVVEPFSSKFSSRFLNAGVAEQNMMSVAAGLASEGYHVFVYSIANFATLRCVEQIRNDVAYHRLSVTIVTVGAGMAYGNLGYSHHAVQDVGVIRTFPEMTILSPADPGETRECVRWLVANPCPSYLRLGKAGESPLHDVRGLELGPLEVISGTDPSALVCTGSILKVALKAAYQLASKERFVSVFSCPWLQPVTPSFFKILLHFKRVVAVEEHVLAGGLASMLHENLPSSVEIVSVALAPNDLGLVGSQDYLRHVAGITETALIQRLTSELLAQS